MSKSHLFPFAAGAFVVAADGTLLLGLLRPIGRSLSSSPAATGQAVTAFALTYALGGPLLVGALRKTAATWTCVATIGFFSLSNAATGAATSLVELIGARIVAGGSAGVFMATAAALAGRSTEREQRGRALATVVGGASLATALGVPLGTFLGGTFGWRAVFFGTSALSALVALILIITRATPTEDARGAGAQTPSSRSAIPILAATLIWATGSFTFFTYVSVVLHRITSVGAVGLAALLLVFGTAGAVGALLGGWLTDVKGPLTTLRLALPAVTASLIALGLLALSGERRAVGLGAATMALYGVGTWAITPPQQHRLIASGGDDRFLLSLNASVLYIGVAVGSAVGGYTLEIFGVSALCLLAAGLELGALVLVMLSGNGL